MGVQLDGVRDLLELARRHVALGKLPAAQLAVCIDGEVALTRTFGCPDDTLFCAYSTTKALTAATVWSLFQDGLLHPDDRVADHVAGFANKPDITIAHLLTHMAGIPSASMPPQAFFDSNERRAHFAAWEAEWAPGSRFTYHPTGAYWALAAAMESAGGDDFRALVKRRIIEPLGLGDVLYLGLPEALGDRVATVVHLGERGGARAMTMDMPAHATDEAYFESYNDPSVRAAGVPSSGAVASAAGLATLYQSLLHAALGDRSGPLQPETVRDALGIRTGDHLDPMSGRLANRALGVIIAGDGHRPYRGFGTTNSASAFGHPGVGGQIAWGDPKTGLSFAFLTSGLDRNTLRMGIRTGALSTCAASISARKRVRIENPLAMLERGTKRALADSGFQYDAAYVERLLPWMERYAAWFDADVRGLEQVPRDRPVLLVGNHSGGVVTPDTAALLARWYRDRGPQQPLVGLGQDFAFAIPGFNSVMRRLGLVPASQQNAHRALGEGHSLLVYPGGAHEVFRPWSERNRIDFGDRKGFIRLALRCGVPVLPVVGHGGHETLMVLSRGDKMARALGLERVRIDILPLALMTPIPLPAKITVDVGAPLDWGHLGPEAADDEAIVQACYDEITGRMQATLDALSTETPRPLLKRLSNLWAA